MFFVYYCLPVTFTLKLLNRLKYPKAINVLQRLGLTFSFFKDWVTLKFHETKRQREFV